MLEKKYDTYWLTWNVDLCWPPQFKCWLLISTIFWEMPEINIWLELNHRCTIELCEKLGAHFFSFVLLPLLYSRTNQPTANKNSYERSGRAEREKRIYEVDFLQGKGAHASEISDFRLIIWSNCKNVSIFLTNMKTQKRCFDVFHFLFFYFSQMNTLVFVNINQRIYFYILMWREGGCFLLQKSGKCWSVSLDH